MQIIDKSVYTFSKRQYIFYREALTRQIPLF